MSEDFDLTDAAGKVVVTDWTDDTVASFIAASGTQNHIELLLLGLLLQGGATVTLPANFIGVAYTP